ncbi:MAG: hypothetical protein U5O39_00155 [Gammaproteobacteria bacterium]|nr:hypothetical protein [Gammaproteobacteria bacterium]
MNAFPVTAFERLGRGPDFLQISPAPVENLPVQIRKMLDHDQHMTRILQTRHGQNLALEVLGLDRSEDGDLREVLLKREQDSIPLQYALLDARLDLLPAETAAALVAARQPLGQILMATAMLRRIEVVSFVRAVPSREFQKAAGTDNPQLYGRHITIDIEAQPAVTVLELLLEPGRNYG